MLISLETEGQLHQMLLFSTNHRPHTNNRGLKATICCQSNEGILVDNVKQTFDLHVLRYLPTACQAFGHSQGLGQVGTESSLVSWGLPVRAMWESRVISSGSENRLIPMTHWTCQITSATLTSALNLDPILPDNITHWRCLKACRGWGGVFVPRCISLKKKIHIFQ